MPQKILGNELPDDAFELLKVGGTATIFATIDEDGYPRTAPIGWTVATDKRTLRAGIGSNKVTYQNLKRDGRVMVCVIDEGNIAIGVRGTARVIDEAMVEIKIEKVKSDALEWVPVTQGIRVNVHGTCPFELAQGKSVLETHKMVVQALHAGKWPVH